MQDIVKTITIEAPISHVWAYLSDQDKFEKWMLSMSGAPVLGETFYFRMTPAAGSDWDGEIKCSVIKMEAPNFLEFTWSHNQLDFAETKVAISLVAVGDSTDVTLVHSGWDAIADKQVRAAQHADHNDGWDIHLGVWQEVATDRSDKGWMERGVEC